MIGFFILLTLLIGISMPVQTAVNSALDKTLGTPLSASFAAFSIGTIISTVIAVCTCGSADFSLVRDFPWYAWTGGICGVTGITLYIVLFPRIGSVQTILLPILGQIATGMLIDLFGWFGMSAKPLPLSGILGFLLVVAGVCMVVIKKSEEADGPKGSKLPFQLLGIFAGVMIASQSAMNGALASMLHSPAVASAFSFLSSTLVLIIILLFSKRDRECVRRIPSVPKVWWQWTGGVIGSGIVLGFAAAAPVLGVGLMTIISILGQLSCSVAIDRFGLIGVRKRKISPIQYAGLAAVLAGSIIIY